MAELEGRVAVVAGGTSGIGFAIAAGLKRSGCEVTALGLPGSEFECAQASPASVGIRFEAVDIADPDAVNALAQRIARLDILVNCAGIIRRGAEFEPDVFEQVVDINLTGTMRICTAFHRHLAESRGVIVNTASMLSFFGGALVPAYSASKGGIAQLTKSLAIAWAPEGIRVNAVAPGWIATPLTAALQADPARAGPILERTPMKRWGRPEDVVGPVLFLCSSAAAFVTGTILPVDGGYSIA